MKFFKNKRILSSITCLLLLATGLLMTGCSKNSVKGETIRILSGSENKILEPILEDCEKSTGVKIEMTYKGSIDIMHELDAGASEYDAVWPASGIWISMGDSGHLVKHNESIAMTPVVFGIKKSLAEQYGLTNRNDVSVKDILTLINEDKLTFCMTSATQSNSGASAYIGFLYALLNKKETLTESDLENTELRRNISALLHGIDRSSGSSDWLKDMFLEGNFDAMVNYEALIIDANQTLQTQGKEPLYVVYPYDGLSLSDSPLGYVEHGNKKKEAAFLAIQEYLLSDKVQKQIEHTGRRIGTSGISEENKNVFCADWGIHTDSILSPITMPSEKVLKKALNLYQTSFRKPSLNVYCLDYSLSMKGEGNKQLIKAMSQILIQKNAEKNLLQAEEDEVNIVITFNGSVQNIYTAGSAKPEDLELLYHSVKEEKISSGTDIYTALIEAMFQINNSYDIKNYTPAIILMSDGVSNTDNEQLFTNTYQNLGLDVPVFSIMFGEAEPEQLEHLAKLTNARVFDGRENLMEAFKTVKGYN